ncbi:unnamed protein product [Schistosoma turkestanicum]|nr:unnamed protein product [Schistosoma turkestanicum]
MVGAPTEIEAINNEEWSQQLAVITRKFNGEHGKHRLHKMTELINATSKVRFSPTSCTTDGTDGNNRVPNDVKLDLSSCNVVDGKSQICKATIWQRLWLKPAEIVTLVSCSTDTS